jgi:hypothetical protein
LHQIIISEGSKLYLTKQLGEDDKHRLFKPCKDLCEVVGYLTLKSNPTYKYPRSLAIKIIETAHFQNFFVKNLHSLAGFGNSKEESKLTACLRDPVFISTK